MAATVATKSSLPSLFCRELALSLRKHQHLVTALFWAIVVPCFITMVAADLTTAHRWGIALVMGTTLVVYCHVANRICNMSPSTLLKYTLGFENVVDNLTVNFTLQNQKKIQVRFEFSKHGIWKAVMTDETFRSIGCGTRQDYGGGCCLHLSGETADPVAIRFFRELIPKRTYQFVDSPKPIPVQIDPTKIPESWDDWRRNYFSPLSVWWKPYKLDDETGSRLVSTQLKYSLMLPVIYVAGVVTYSVTLIGRIVGLVKDIFVCLWLLAHRQIGLAGEVMTNGSIDLASGIVGVVAPPLAYRIDEWLIRSMDEEAVKYILLHQSNLYRE